MATTHVPIAVPDLGVSDEEEIVVSCWLVATGDAVIEGDRLVELLIGEATFDVASPATGVLTRIVAEIDELVRVGDILGQINADDP